ncbi:clathrin interactor EPSIN 1-like isoform X1 [Cucurbita maxima]|uniref:Clathrin interactor EPSIN 1-like isoform X1 n=1 Tax=Cucurbita maxima TaxID=3661 RepID=A0A6J1KP24_CUCMA|nr:clathrin interactor EPSIN 1-like isoform X1 [Cucurbita maxima]XP_023001950.1 clathrin interactor EPSIN 1-like isoform X1 [Cucurbita maxima]
MDFMKVFDQTVREIKREVNLKVLKVPEIEQKVLDATDDEPWGPHGSALAEIAQATKKFSETQMVMSVLWTRLSETGKNWRLVYKALAVIEYLVSHGSERAVDDIIEHTFQISSLSNFEYVEPSGKDMGINVRKKAENIVALLNDKDKIQEVRNKAAANREKYFGLSSTGITYKSGSASYGSSSFSSDSYQGQSSFRSDRFRDRSSGRDSFRKEKEDQDDFKRSNWSTKQDYSKGSAQDSSKDQSKTSSGTSKFSKKSNDSANKGVSFSSSPQTNSSDEDFDDFDPRGNSTTTTTKAAVPSPNGVDLFEDSLIGDLMDAPTLVPPGKPDSNSPEVDLFADATFVSASPPMEKEPNSSLKAEVDLFASQPASVSTPVDFFGSPEPVVQTGTNFAGAARDSKASQPASLSATFDFFASSEPIVQTETNFAGAARDIKASKPASVSAPIDIFASPGPVLQTETIASAATNSKVVDPFAALPLNSFDGSDLFGAPSSHSEPVSSVEPSQNPVSCPSNNPDGKSIKSSSAPAKKNTFQVKSGIWADSLSRGLIDLNISAPKKVSLVDVGVMGGLSDFSDELVKGPAPTYHMGQAMGAGSGLGRTGSQAMGDDFFSQLSGQQYQFGAFQK